MRRLSLALLYYFLLFACFNFPALSNSLVPLLRHTPSLCLQPLDSTWLCLCSSPPSPVLTATSDRHLRLTRQLHSILPHSPDEIIPPHLVRFPHQWTHCSLIKAKPFLAVETFAHQCISLRPHQLKHFSIPAPRLPAAFLGCLGRIDKVPLRVPVWDALTPREAPRSMCSLN